MDLRELVPEANRALLASGFQVEGLRRTPRYAMLRCRRIGILGAEFKLLLGLTSNDEFEDSEIQMLRKDAELEGRQPILVTRLGSDVALSHADFFRTVGGSVPSWRALSVDFRDALRSASQNMPVEGEDGEPWFLFEQLVADGLEFCLGRRTNRLGGIRRGVPVPDLVAELPTGHLVVVDAKATAGAFDAGLANLRPLGEYLARQLGREGGGNAIVGTLVVSSRFSQDEGRLKDTALSFSAEHGRPVAFLEADVLADMVEAFAGRPLLRNRVRWGHLLRGGLVTLDQFRDEFRNAEIEHMPRE